MNKQLLIIGLFLYSFTALYGQNKESNRIIKVLKSVKTVKDAGLLLKNETSVVGEILSINPRTDTSDFDKLILSKKDGETFSLELNDSEFGYLAKLINWEKVVYNRVNYIYLDNNIYSKLQIDSIRTIIIEKLEAGENFADLASKYSMDGNSKKGGDLGWIKEGYLVKSFEDEINSHSLNEVFNVDVPENKWFYVVKKTYEPIEERILNAIVIKIKK
jgi:hypothetical protein